MLGRLTATGMVIASMVGTGVFISLGFQVETISSTSALLLLWFVGGVYALCGAFCYAELASRMPRSGGEYNFLTKIYHPSIGFLAGWISVIVGFAAPTAVAALVVGKFTSATPHNQTSIAIAVILLCGGVHFFTAKIGHSFQNIFTAVKIILLVGFSILCFLMITNPQPVSIIPRAGDFEVIFSEHFAEAFVWVTFSYSGWNAAVYVTGEIREASRVIPFALLLGTTIVTFLYLLLNYTFLQSIPFVELQDLHFMDTLKPGIRDKDSKRY